MSVYIYYLTDSLGQKLDPASLGPLQVCNREASQDCVLIWKIDAERCTSKITQVVGRIHFLVTMQLIKACFFKVTQKASWLAQ